MLRCGLVLDDLGVFFSNDNHNAFDIRFYHCVFLRFNTFQHLVGHIDMAYAVCIDCGQFLSRMQVFRPNRQVYKAKIQTEKQALFVKGGGRLFLQKIANISTKDYQIQLIFLRVTVKMLYVGIWHQE